MHRSRMFSVGLVILALLSIGELFGPLLTDGEHPPMLVALIGAALGLLSLVLIFFAQRGSRGALAGLLVLRLLSALMAVPAFSTPGVPPAAKTMAGIFIALTVAGVVLVLGGRRVTAAAR